MSAASQLSPLWAVPGFLAIGLFIYCVIKSVQGFNLVTGQAHGMPVCTQCGHLVPVGLLICPNCGNGAYGRCGACGQPIVAPVDRCPSCATPVRRTCPLCGNVMNPYLSATGAVHRTCPYCHYCTDAGYDETYAAVQFDQAPGRFH